MILPKQGSQQSQAQGGFQFRRMAAIQKKISEINPEKDIRVRLMGRVIDKYDSTIVLDDGTAKAEIVVEDINISFNDVNSSDLIRVFARVLPLETSYELRAEIIQKMTEKDFELYKRTKG